jgi:hypothetical protein
MRARGSGSRDRLRAMKAEEPGCRSGAEENSVCAWEARERIKAGACISRGYSWRAEVSMRGPGLSSSDMPSMVVALRASGADAGAENGCPAPNQALLLTRKIWDGKACPRLAAAASLEDRCRRAAERQPLAGARM